MGCNICKKTPLSFIKFKRIFLNTVKKLKKNILKTCCYVDKINDAIHDMIFEIKYLDYIIVVTHSSIEQGFIMTFQHKICIKSSLSHFIID